MYLQQGCVHLISSNFDWPVLRGSPITTAICQGLRWEGNSLGISPQEPSVSGSPFLQASYTIPIQGILMGVVREYYGWLGVPLLKVPGISLELLTGQVNLEDGDTICVVKRLREFSNN